MTTTETAADHAADAHHPNGKGPDHDVVIIGAGVAGIYQLYKLKGTGLSVRVLEAGTNVGGTWYWNRYPLARFDSESYSYGYFFSKELFDEWQWSEHFAGQPETERYLNFVVDRYDLRDDFQFNARVASATFDEAANIWTLTLSNGDTVTTRFVVAATGLLSAPFFPDIAGKDTFTGESYHTGLWPKEPVAFAGKRVAVIGTGASAVQLLPGIASEVASMTVYQRTPNWCAPLNNGLITPEEQQDIRDNYDELVELVRTSFAGFAHADGTRGTFEDTREQRWAFYEMLWHKRGFAKLFSNYNDILVDPRANAEFCEFLADKIRQRVHDPATAEKLIPKDHGYGMKRPPMESGYYEVFNLPSVSLVDLHETPIERITETGVVTADGEEAFDMIIWATGFDAVTGALTRMGVVGSDGLALADFWSDGPRTYLGVSIPHFPNFLFVGGPHFPFANVPRGADIQVDFVTNLLLHAAEMGYARVEPDEAAEADWTDHVLEASAPFLVAETSWFRGANIPGKADKFMLYTGGLVTYGNRLNSVAADGYDGFTLTPAPSPVSRV